jgi:hypothetical protein
MRNYLTRKNKLDLLYTFYSSNGMLRLAGLQLLANPFKILPTEEKKKLGKVVHVCHPS